MVLVVLWQSHSLRCTESFMKDNVMGELRQVHPDDESKMKMLEILKRFQSEEEQDEDCSIDDDGIFFLFLFVLLDQIFACFLIISKCKFCSSNSLYVVLVAY